MADQFHSQPGDRQLFEQAFAYIAGELDGDEERQFEYRLETDEHAQRAVVSAMSLARSVDAVFANEPARSSLPGFARFDADRGLQSTRKWKQTLAPVAVFALAVTLLGVALFFVVPGFQRQPVARSSAGESAQSDSNNQAIHPGSVAEAWFDTVNEWDWDEPAMVAIATGEDPWPLSGEDPWPLSSGDSINPEWNRGEPGDGQSADDLHWMVVAAELNSPDDSR